VPEFSDLTDAIRGDFRAASRKQRLWLIMTALWLAYEWGPGNETLTPWILARIIGRNNGIVVIPVTFAVGFAFTTAQQLASGWTALAGFSSFDRTSQAAWAKLRGGRTSVPRNWYGLSWWARCSVVFTLGTTAVALIQVMTTGEVGVRRHASAIRSSAILCGAIVGTIGGCAATVAYLGRRVHVLTSGTNWVIRILGNPLFWLGLVVIFGVFRAASRRAADVDVDEDVESTGSAVADSQDNAS
jgi:hypothetical protein